MYCDLPIEYLRALFRSLPQRYPPGRCHSFSVPAHPTFLPSLGNLPAVPCANCGELPTARQKAHYFFRPQQLLFQLRARTQHFTTSQKLQFAQLTKISASSHKKIFPRVKICLQQRSARILSLFSRIPVSSWVNQRLMHRRRPTKVRPLMLRAATYWSSSFILSPLTHKISL